MGARRQVQGGASAPPWILSSNFGTIITFPRKHFISKVIDSFGSHIRHLQFLFDRPPGCTDEV